MAGGVDPRAGFNPDLLSLIDTMKGGSKPANIDLKNVNVEEANKAWSALVSTYDLNFTGDSRAATNKLLEVLGVQTSPVEAPNPGDSTHPEGGLTTDKDGKIHTPGGYTIEATDQYEWKITGPDGKSTKVWGDPHVEESDGGKWDFKRPSTFVLGDGTKIDVSVKPYNNMTVTSGLTITSGNDRIAVTDIDKGKGKVGANTHDGFQHVNDKAVAGNDVFVMGQNAADWAFTGKEIIGDNNGGESFKLGKDLAPLTNTTKPYGGPQNWAQKLLESVMKIFQDLLPMIQDQITPPWMNGNTGINPNASVQQATQSVLDKVTAGGDPLGLQSRWNEINGNTGINPNPTGNRANQLSDAFRLVGDMLRVIQDILDMTRAVQRPQIRAF